MGLGKLWKHFLDPAGGLLEFPSLNLRADGTSHLVLHRRVLILIFSS